MSVLREIHDRLASLEAHLSDRPAEASEVRAIRQLLDKEEANWIGTVEAQRLLGVQSVNTVKAWARRGWLRSRQLPNGRLLVSLEDVLARRGVDEALSLFGSDAEMTEEERERSKHPIAPELEAIVQVLVGKSRQSAAARGTR